jgi:hypothetical protein
MSEKAKIALEASKAQIEASFVVPDEPVRPQEYISSVRTLNSTKNGENESIDQQLGGEKEQGGENNGSGIKEEEEDDAVLGMEEDLAKEDNFLGDEHEHEHEHAMIEV